MDLELTDNAGDASDHHELVEKRRKSTRKFVLACAAFASINNVLIGYDVGVMSGAILFIKEDLKTTEVQEEIFLGILSIISILGILAGGRISDAVGRKPAMGLAAFVFQAGAVIMTVSPTFEVLMIGRILAGIGIGFGVMIAPVYIAEISPAFARGSLTSFPEIFINLGILLGYVSNYAFSGLPAHLNWRIMLAVGILPAVFIAFALCIIPESPRWLVMQNRIQEARAILLKTNDNDTEVDERLSEIQLAAGITDAEKHQSKAVWRELLSPSPALRRMMITGFGIQCFQQITGIDATIYYSPKIFKAAGIDGNSNLLAATVAVGVTKTAFILVAIVLIDKVGRKPLLYVSTIGMTLCLFTLGTSLSIPGEGSVGIALAILSVSLGGVCSRVCSGLIAMSFLSVSHAITTAGIFLVFSLLSAISVAFVYTMVPETKGKSLEQIELLFQNNICGGFGNKNFISLKFLGDKHKVSARTA
ncbi:unnamed protein product [Coffea canephora]|uniref:Major facilitator superfamily (MFS) profile domain-containing protein n=1 Tax=Coffea canephora TaxID=49390 RepID=A0A068V2P4_COFCA|nr:unnamed protein product [Coffea canephora]